MWKVIVTEFLTLDSVYEDSISRQHGWVSEQAHEGN